MLKCYYYIFNKVIIKVFILYYIVIKNVIFKYTCKLLYISLNISFIYNYIPINLIVYIIV